MDNSKSTERSSNIEVNENITCFGNGRQWQCSHTEYDRYHSNNDPGQPSQIPIRKTKILFYFSGMGMTFESFKFIRHHIFLSII